MGEIQDLCIVEYFVFEMKELISQANLAEAAKQIEEVPVTFEDFLASLKNVSRSVGTEDLQRFQDWMAEFGATI